MLPGSRPADVRGKRQAVHPRPGAGTLHIQFIGQVTDFSGPFGVWSSSGGRFYVADDLAHRILIFDRERKLLGTIGKKGTGPGDLAWVDALAIDSGGHLYIADTGNDRIQILDQAHQVIKSFGGSVRRVLFRAGTAAGLSARATLNLASPEHVGRQRLCHFIEEGRELPRQDATFESFKLHAVGWRNV